MLHRNLMILVMLFMVNVTFATSLLVKVQPPFLTDGLVEPVKYCIEYRV